MSEVLKELDKSEDIGQPDVDKANPEKVAKVLDNSDNVLPEDFEFEEADKEGKDVNILRAEKYIEEKQPDEKLQAEETLFSKQKSSVLKFNNS